eukprot:jgi/Mesvir1/24421/Mv11081-RA.1
MCVECPHSGSAYLCTYLAANIAALRAADRERVTGEVNTERLLKAGQCLPILPVASKRDGWLQSGNREPRAGSFYPVCDATKGASGGDAAPRRFACALHRYTGAASGVAAQAGATSRGAVIRRSDGYSPLFCHALFHSKNNDRVLSADIEGSTSLWEWNPEVMKRSLAIHHRVLRSLLPKYHGYESDTEGDSFSLIFHDAIDALGWAMEVQRQLLFPAGSLGVPGGVPPSNPSSTGLSGLQHNGGPLVAFLEGSSVSHTGTSGSAGSGTASGSHSSGQSTVELIPTTATSSYQLVPTTSSRHVVPVATVISWSRRRQVASAVRGASGQHWPVYCRARGWGRVEDHLVPAERINSENHQLVLASSRASFILPAGSRASLSCGVTDWPPELLLFEACQEVADPREGCVIYRGLRVRMGIHTGVPDACIMHPNGRQHYQGEVVEMTKAIVGAAMLGGQVLMSMAAWRSLGTHMRNVVCHHMGLHELAERLPPIHLMQVVPAELAHRAIFHPLRSKQISPSFFDAPDAEHCYRTGESPRDPLVVCFIYVGGASALSRIANYHDALGLFVAFVQERLGRYDAYECEEKDGNFLLAFASAVKAACFAEAVQREAMTIEWPESLLEHDAAAEVVKMGRGDGGSPRLDCVVFRGFRLQIGMCMGVPSDCQPHMTTGRAAYFGAVVNRAARIAATAAPGQSLANQEVYESARGQTGDVTFQELGEFGLKGVREQLCLYEISSPALSLRLFPRTRKLAKSQPPPTNFDSDVDRKQLSQPSTSSPKGGETRVLPPGAAATFELTPHSAFKAQLGGILP